MNSKTAVLIFANSAEVDSSRKQFSNGKVLFDKLNQNVVQKVKKTNLPYFIITEKKQHGQNFGERYHNALKTIFDKGFDNVISIGNDTPQLKTDHILESQASLLKFESAIGPSTDGGFYLLGIDKNTFDQLDFEDFTWQSPQLFSQFQSALKKLNQNVICLARFADVDLVEDLKYFQNFFKHISKELQSLISIILQQFKSVFLDINLISSGLYAQIPFNKGSPKSILG